MKRKNFLRLMALLLSLVFFAGCVAQNRRPNQKKNKPLRSRNRNLWKKPPPRWWP